MFIAVKAAALSDLFQKDGDGETIRIQKMVQTTILMFATQGAKEINVTFPHSLSIIRETLIPFNRAGYLVTLKFDNSKGETSANIRWQ